MSMIGWQTGALRAMHTSGKCDAPEIARRLTITRAVAGETDAAFLPVGDDDLFRKHSAALTSALDNAIAAAPAGTMRSAPRWPTSAPRARPATRTSAERRRRSEHRLNTAPQLCGRSVQRVYGRRQAEP